jgi:serine/threonine protein kinase
MAIEELQDGRYRHLRLLGTGGMGEVYLMQDKRVNRRVAIKVLRAETSLYPDEEKAISSVRLFEREARAIAALDHPNILPLYDFGEEDRDGVTITYMVMPYCADGSLESWLRQRGGELLSPPQVAALIEQAAEALDYAHEHKVIHLDVKPSNFLIRGNRRDPDRPTLMLADFGIARNFGTVSSSSRTIRGTPAAMSPEQWSGEPVFASDQYALAVMAYEMLVGRPPFVGSMEQLMYRHFTVQAPPLSTFNPRLPAALDGVLQRALSKKPEERYPSIVEFASALSEAASQPGALAGTEGAEYATLALSPSEAEAGISRMLTLAGGEEVTVSVPAGAQDGQVLRLPGRSSSSSGGEGVVLVNIAVQKKPEASSAVAVSNDSGQDLESSSNAMVSEDEPEPETVVSAKLVPEAPVEQAPERLKLAKVSLADSAQISVPGHDLPTVAGLEDATVAPVAKRSRSRFGVIALISLFVVLALLAGSIYAFVSHGSSVANVQPTPTHVGAIATSTPHATPTPTVAPGLYIAGTYNGSMADTNGGNYTRIAVKLDQTNGSGALKGYVTFNSSYQQTYALQGTVDMQGNFTFAVQQATGQTPLVFYGATQSGNYLHGDYCHTTARTCPMSEGYFTVGPRE